MIVGRTAVLLSSEELVECGLLLCRAPKLEHHAMENVFVRDLALVHTGERLRMDAPNQRDFLARIDLTGHTDFLRKSKVGDQQSGAKWTNSSQLPRIPRHRTPNAVTIADLAGKTRP